jgi:hypothetical protein
MKKSKLIWVGDKKVQVHRTSQVPTKIKRVSLKICNKKEVKDRRNKNRNHKLKSKILIFLIIIIIIYLSKIKININSHYNNNFKYN